MLFIFHSKIGLLVLIRVMVLTKSTVDSLLFYAKIGMKSQNRIIIVYDDFFSYESNNPRWKEATGKPNFSVYKNQKESVKKW